jgi:cardiolipin synthase
MGWEIIAITFVIWLTLVILFTPRIDYRVTAPTRPDSEEFFHVLQMTCEAPVFGGNRVDVLTNGAQFYPAMRDVILQATASVNLEAYIFQPGEAADMLIDAMVARAREGVTVRLVLDAIGSFGMRGRPIRRLREAGVEVRFYQPLRWYRLHRLNNRTHRELLIVDGRVAFCGGAGVADWWYKPGRRRLRRHVPAWRDTAARIDGPIVAALQGVFAENWLECGGEILTSPRDWPPLEPMGAASAMVVKSSPADRATTSRVVFQMLIDGAVAEIDISTPYFLPDRSLRRSLVRAARRMYGELLEGGIRLFEYRPAMTHVKALMVDGTWAVIGTTNVDNRSFEHNDEVNVAFREARVTARLKRDFESDLAACDEVTAERWHRRSALEKMVGPLCWILERQQ